MLKSVIYSVTTTHSQSRKRAICTTKRHTVNPKNKSRKNKAMSSSSSSSEKTRNEKRVEIRKKFDIQKGSLSFTLSLGEVLTPRSAERGRTGTASTQSRGGWAPCHHAKSGTGFSFSFSFSFHLHPRSMGKGLERLGPELRRVRRGEHWRAVAVHHHIDRLLLVAVAHVDRGHIRVDHEALSRRHIQRGGDPVAVGRWRNRKPVGRSLRQWGRRKLE